MNDTRPPIKNWLETGKAGTPVQDHPGATVFRAELRQGGPPLWVIVSHDDLWADSQIAAARELTEMRLHLLVGHVYRRPSWEEIGQCIDERMDSDRDYVITVARHEHWVASHVECVHIWETKDSALQSRMAAEREAIAPVT